MVNLSTKCELKTQLVKQTKIHARITYKQPNNQGISIQHNSQIPITYKLSLAQKLNLYLCGIQSIQAFGSLDAPKLEIINLIYNNIVQYKCLNKCNFNLWQLHIYSMRNWVQLEECNPNVKLDHCERWNFTITNLRLEKHEYNSVVRNDLSFLSKLKTKSMAQTNIFTTYESRIAQKRVSKKLRKANISLMRYSDRSQQYISNSEQDIGFQLNNLVI